MRTCMTRVQVVMQGSHVMQVPNHPETRYPPVHGWLRLLLAPNRHTGVLTTAAATRPDPWNGSKAEVIAATEAWSPISASARYLVRNTPP
jgi:hypothetical protein